MTALLSAACAALVILSPSSAFSPSHISNHATRNTALSASKDGEIGTSTRRGFFGNVATATAAIGGVASVWMQPAPALAYGLNKANDKLARYVKFCIPY